MYSLEKRRASSSSTEIPLPLESAPCDSHCGRARQGRQSSPHWPRTAPRYPPPTAAAAHSAHADLVPIKSTTGMAALLCLEPQTDSTSTSSGMSTWTLKALLCLPAHCNSALGPAESCAPRAASVQPQHVYLDPHILHGGGSQCRSPPAGPPDF